ncbi:hypothetical protein O6H91_16G011300 [Diphasiastrum complanatum]|uniref:Uncharacterized protein n=1 Tax=Diphasiastrum complanatum TaxID=34168 RepID=A0ACC2B9U0_DIPCM|nr:hypothetical protein O6H91_16G011300 [Diphasiastrum complanatum]
MGWALALHGGAGNIPRSISPQRKDAAEACLRECLRIGGSALESSISALDVVEMVVNELENNPVFNAGRGSVLTNRGTVEMEALIMDGSTGNCGAVSGLCTVVNPISLARLVMEKTPHIYLAFEGAEQFAKQQGVKTAASSYFITEENQDRLVHAKQANRVLVLDHTASNTIKQTENHDSLNISLAPGTPIGDAGDTVGCVAVDKQGNCAAATSTGGLVNKMVGRIGDTPLVGCGTYANHLCAISATGKGEAIIKATLAREVAALVEYKQLPLTEAVDQVVKGRLGQGNGGLVAVSNAGDVAMAFNSTGMFRATVDSTGRSEVSIWH